MYLAMNRFQVKQGKEEEFISIWRERHSYLDEVAGFKSFHLLRGKTQNEITLFSSHSVWDSCHDFKNWTHSELFRKAHANVGKTSQDMYIGHPTLELFESVL